MNYTLESSAKLQSIYEDRNAPESTRLMAWHELRKRWKDQPVPQTISNKYYKHSIHFMPRP